MRHRRPARTFTINPLESLDERIVPSTSGLTPAALGFTPEADAGNEAVVAAHAGPVLGVIYQEYINYEVAGAQGAFSPGEAGQIFFSGTAVGVNITASAGNFSNMLSYLQGMGMAVTGTAPQQGVIGGYLAIWQLPLIVTNTNEASISPMYEPSFSASTAAPGLTTTEVNNEAVVAAHTGPALSAIYQEFTNYYAAGSQGAFSPSQAGQIFFSGTAVGVNITASSGNFSNMLSYLQGMGMAVTGTAPQQGVIAGYLPIWELPLVVTNTDEASISPIYRPIMY
jgi:hypothetical protein